MVYGGIKRATTFPVVAIEKAYQLYKMGHKTESISLIMAKDGEWHPKPATVLMWRLKYGWDERVVKEQSEENKQASQSMQGFQNRLLEQLEKIENVAIGGIEGGLKPKSFDSAVRGFLAASGMQNEIVTRLANADLINKIGEIILDEIDDPVKLQRIAVKMRGLLNTPMKSIPAP